MPKFSDKYLVYSILTILFGCFVVVVFSTENSFGGGDHFLHYNLAHWGWKYPDMLFRHWGKPVFTILISPFAQFGMNGARIYNVLVGLSTAYFTWRIAKHLKMSQAWAVLFFVLYTPIYFILMFTSLTEVTFSFFLVLSIFLFFKEKYIWSAVVFSFAPLIRNEAIILLPLFIAAYSLKRQFVALPFLTLGFFVISFFGWPFHGELWWVITKMPYAGGAVDIYGSGELFHFLKKNHKILGWCLGILFIIGTMIYSLVWSVKDKFKLTDNFYFLLLVVGSFVLFFTSHSYVWWQGMGNSLGLLRVIGSVTPLAALTALMPISSLYKMNRKYLSFATSILLIGIISWVTYDGIQKHKSGFYVASTLQLYDEASQYILENNLERNKIFYFSTYLIYKLELDPLEPNRSEKVSPQGETLLGVLPDSSIVVWDAQKGPNEGKIPLDMLLAREDLNVLKIFRPNKSFKVLGGHDYQIVIFQKNVSQKTKLRKLTEGFELANNGSSENVFKGNKSFKIENHNQYKTILGAIVHEVVNTLEPIEIDINIAYCYSFGTEPRQLQMVCKLESNEGNVFYESIDMWTKEVKDNSWIEKSFQFILPKPHSLNNRLKVYVWNFGGNEVFLDEVSIKIRPAAQYNSQLEALDN